MNFSSSTLNFSILPYQEGIKPPVTKPNPAFLTDIGEEGMRALLDRFYMDLFQSPIKELFPKEIDVMKDAGQIPYFNQNRGTPQMGKRHAPFAITPDSRLHWLVCFEEALQPIIDDKQSSEENIQSFWDYLNVFSIWMINARG